MAKEWDKIQATFKKLQPQIKKLDPAPVEKFIKQIKAALESTWKAEDVFAEAIKKAKEGGLKGKKVSDFTSDKPVKDSLAALMKEAVKHADLVSDLKKLSEPAKVPNKEMAVLLRDVKKHIDKKDKTQVKFQADLKSDYVKVQAVATAMGKLTPAETFYGSQIDKVVDRVINKSKNAGPSGDAVKLIETKERAKYLKAAVKQALQISKLCDACLKWAEANPTKPTAKYLTKIAALIKKLKAVDTAYQAVKKKNMKLINQSKDKAKIIKDISSISDAYKASVAKFSDTIGKIKEMSP